MRAPLLTGRSAGLLCAALLGTACGGSSTPAAPPITPNTSGWWRNQVGYEIFVRSFADSDGDGIGDLRGLTAKLPELNDGAPAASTNSLGVDFVWLMPVFPSPSYHGYDVTDYRAINPQYGTLADFDAFVAEAHAGGTSGSCSTWCSTTPRRSTPGSRTRPRPPPRRSATGTSGARPIRAG